MGIGNFVALINPLIIEQDIDKYISVKEIKGLITLCSVAAILNIIMVVCIKIRMFLMAKTSNKVIEEVREDLYTHIQSLDLPFFDSRPTGKILARITGDVNSLKDVIENSVTTLVPELITVIAVTIIMFVKNSKLAAATLISLPPMILGIFVISINAEKHWKKFRKKSSKMNAFVNDD